MLVFKNLTIKGTNMAQPTSSWGSYDPNKNLLNPAVKGVKPNSSQLSTTPSLGGRSVTHQPAKSQDWSQLLTPSIQGHAEMRNVDAISQKFVSESGNKDGALSSKTHQNQMAVIDKSLDIMALEMGAILKSVVITVNKFMNQVHASNDDIGSYCNAIIKRAIANDPTLGVDDLVKATAIVQFTEMAVKSVNSSSNAALDMAERGGNIISKLTFAAVLGIIDTRSKQVALFSQKVEIFQKQEKHDLDIMLQMQKAKLDEQALLFNQMKEVVEIESKMRKDEFNQQMELRKSDLEHQLQNRALDIKQEEANNAKALKEEELRIGERMQSKQMQINKELDDRRITTDAQVKNQALSYDFQARKFESADKKEAAMWDSTTKALSPCSIQ